MAKVIGLSGGTCSGKSSVAKCLVPRWQDEHETPCLLIGMDDYFWPEDSVHHTLHAEHGFPLWEELNAVDWCHLLKDVASAVDKAGPHGLVIVEGILVLNQEALRRHFTHSFFLTLDDQQLMRERRQGRCYEPPDPSWYFDEEVWPKYVRNLNALQEVAGIQYFDGTGFSTEELTDIVYRSIQ